MSIDSYSRRSFLTTTGLAVGAALVSTSRAEAPKLHQYKDYGWLRGFSVVPSWSARIEEAWWLYDGARFREEVNLAKQVHANCIRLWIEFTAWMADPDKVTAHFLDAVAAIDEAGMKTMPCLFNRWHDTRYDYGGTYIENIIKGWKQHLEYVRAIATPLAKDDRVLIWDMCNEPQTGAYWAKEMTDAYAKKEHGWLSDIARTLRECAVQQPISMGTMNGPNIEAFADLCDVLCGHPYAHDRAGLEKLVTDYDRLRQQTGKPLLVNECMPGSFDDATRGEVARYYSEILTAAGTGWMGWALREGNAISTRRDRVDGNGINSEGYHPFFTKEGKLRGGLEFMTEKPKQLPPWQKA